MSALEKVLALSQLDHAVGVVAPQDVVLTGTVVPSPEGVSAASELVMAALADLAELRVLLASPQPSDDEDEEDDDSGKGGSKGGGSHSGHPTYKKLVGRNVDPKRAATMCARADRRINAAALIEAAEIALTGLGASGSDWVEATAGVSELVALASGKTPSRPYGNVSYADPGVRGKARYPVDTPEHTRAAWSYINQRGNAAKYSPEELASIKAKIKLAMKRHGIGGGDAGDKVEASYVVELAFPPAKGKRGKGGPPMPPQNMRHGSFTGAHSHGHTTQTVHDHDHFHNNDSSHDFHAHDGDGSGQETGGGWRDRDW